MSRRLKKVESPPTETPEVLPEIPQQAMAVLMAAGAKVEEAKAHFHTVLSTVILTLGYDPKLYGVQNHEGKLRLYRFPVKP